MCRESVEVVCLRGAVLYCNAPCKLAPAQGNDTDVVAAPGGFTAPFRDNEVVALGFGYKG